MMRRVAASFQSHFDNFDEDRTDVDELPNNYNDTKTELVTMNGQQFIKKKTVIRKGSPGAQIFITSVSYIPVDETENVEPGSNVDAVGAGAAGSTAAPKFDLPEA